MVTINLTFCCYEIYPEERKVVTVFPDGYKCEGMRDEADPTNIREAESQGYEGEDKVWRSLVEHELLHSIVAETLYNRESFVMATESGRGFTPTWLRYEEEMLVIALQRYFNGWERSAGLILTRYPELDNFEGWWRLTYLPQLMKVFEPEI